LPVYVLNTLGRFKTGSDCSD